MFSTSFLLSDVNFSESDLILPKLGIQFDQETYLSQDYFYIDIPEVAKFEIENGQSIRYQLYANANPDLVVLYLNGSILAALLHQRKQLIFHASSFVYEDQTIMICGESEAGKSSLSLAFCLETSRFLNDDISPIIFNNNQAWILPMGKKMKLWKDSLFQLKLENELFEKVESNNEKYYYDLKSELKECKLDLIVLLEIYEGDEVLSIELSGIEKFEALRNQIYRQEYLVYMPESEKKYMKELMMLSTCLKVYLVKRPKKMKINETKIFLEKLFKKN